MITYFGYGLMSSADVMEAVIGRRPEGSPASVAGMKLGIQRIDQVVPAAQKLLRTEWPDSFRSYVIIPDARGTVRGVVWEVTESERAIIRDWELVDLGWYDVVSIIAVKADGSSVTATAEVLAEGQRYDSNVHEELYPVFLNPAKEVMRVAKKCREEFLAKK